MTIPSTKKITPEVLAMMVEQLPSVRSFRDLAAMFGVSLQAVSKEITPILAIMKLQGTHPKCGCGRDRFHMYGCVDKTGHKIGVRNGAWITPELRAAGLARRARVIEAIMTGDTYRAIEQRLGMPPKTAKGFTIYMTPEQRAQRKRLEAARLPAGQETPRRPFSDPLYARIASAVPRWVTDATRDDIISEMYLAVREGTLTEDAIEANAWRFASQAVAMWESRYGTRSIDEPMFSDSDRTLADMLPDPQALAAFDHISIGQPDWRAGA